MTYCPDYNNIWQRVHYGKSMSDAITCMDYPKKTEKDVVLACIL